MGKAKSSKSALPGPLKAVHSRVSYLYQAAAYLATATTADEKADVGSKKIKTNLSVSRCPTQTASRRFISDLRAVSHKVQLRMTPEMKHTMCKNCDTFLMDGSTCTNKVENRSKGAQKPWAEVLLRKCTICGHESRFPLTARRQKRRPQRVVETLQEEVKDGINTSNG